jgi:hypothetical protein
MVKRCEDQRKYQRGGLADFADILQRVVCVREHLHQDDHREIRQTDRADHRAPIPPREPRALSMPKLRPAPKPTPYNGDLANLPAALAPRTQHQRWCCLRWVWRPDQERWDKPPLQASNPHLPAKSNDPATWGSYTNAVAAVAAGQADGIGYMLADDDLDAVDLDHCRDPHTGEVAEWAQAEIDAANSYAEVTVSGMGLRILGIGSGGRASPQIQDSQHDERCSGGFTPEPTDTSPSAARRSVAAIEALRHSAGYLRRPVSRTSLRRPTMQVQAE